MVPFAAGLRVSLTLEILNRSSHRRGRGVADNRFSQHDSLGGKSRGCRLFQGQLFFTVKDAEGAKAYVRERLPDHVEDRAPVRGIHLNHSTRYDCDYALHIGCMVSQPYCVVQGRMSTIAQLASWLLKRGAPVLSWGTRVMPY